MRMNYEQVEATEGSLVYQVCVWTKSIRSNAKRPYDDFLEF